MSLDRDQIRTYIMDEAKEIKLRIKKEIKGKYIFLKFDCATRLRVNYLGLNIRYVNAAGKSITRTLGVVDTLCEHGSKMLKEMIVKVLADYEIPLDHVVCCVTDNASNMIKLVELLNEDIQKEHHVDDGEGDIDEEDEEDDIEEGELQLESVIPPSCEHMRCAAHTLQLAVNDGLKHATAKGVVSKIRGIAKEARNPNIDKLLQKSAKKGALIDMETRWGSTFMMIDRLVELKTHLIEMAQIGNKKLTLTEAEWEQATSLRDLLQKAFAMTKALQYEDCSPGNFYRKWSGSKLYYIQYDSSLAGFIGKSMIKKENKLLEM